MTSKKPKMEKKTLRNVLSFSELDPSTIASLFNCYVLNHSILRFSRGWHCTSLKRTLLIEPCTYLHAHGTVFLVENDIAQALSFYPVEPLYKDLYQTF